MNGIVPAPWRRLRRAWELLLEWWLSPLPRRRVAWLRVAVYGFVFLDVLWLRPWVGDYGHLPPDQYHPLMIGRLLPLPTPTPLFVDAVKYTMLACAAVAATGRLVKLAGAAVFCLYLEWMVIAFSYGKVDHDRVAFLVALAVLPTVGKVSWGDKTADEKAGWAITCIQLAVVATYFLSTFAKFRFGGPDWVNGATLLRAVLRRGTDLAEPLAGMPWVLHIGQWFIVMFELSSPLMLTRGRIGRFFLASAVLFHTITWLTIRIMFWPHVLCLLAFLPLERIERPGRLKATGRARARRARSARGSLYSRPASRRRHRRGGGDTAVGATFPIE
ncbi:MAG TPA: HTTM domain-containing protein [Actinomycetota bacterium]|nr:HTTM domain-containing protein [Actinomycetota bacterium]